MTDIGLCVDACRVKTSVLASEFLTRGCSTTTGEKQRPPLDKGGLQGGFTPRSFFEDEHEDDSKSSPLPFFERELTCHETGT
jgi:hypothetical protein